mmetsp:Transcript_41676/g.102832  ORF Transcript_41676/g.102832 Transcript_41676/m.102832 type:complete len:302 (+) Transcript_41676:179-1084(+)
MGENTSQAYCLRCGKAYASNDGVRKHAKRDHPEWIVEMDLRGEYSFSQTPPAPAAMVSAGRPKFLLPAPSLALMPGAGVPALMPSPHGGAHATHVAYPSSQQGAAHAAHAAGCAAGYAAATAHLGQYGMAGYAPGIPLAQPRAFLEAQMAAASTAGMYAHPTTVGWPPIQPMSHFLPRSTGEAVAWAQGAPHQQLQATAQYGEPRPQSHLNLHPCAFSSALTPGGGGLGGGHAAIGLGGPPRFENAAPEISPRIPARWAPEQPRGLSAGRGLIAAADSVPVPMSDSFGFFLVFFWFWFFGF